MNQLLGVFLIHDILGFDISVDNRETVKVINSSYDLLRHHGNLSFLHSSAWIISQRTVGNGHEYLNWFPKFPTLWVHKANNVLLYMTILKYPEQLNKHRFTCSKLASISTSPLAVSNRSFSFPLSTRIISTAIMLPSCRSITRLTDPMGPFPICSSSCYTISDHAISLWVPLVLWPVFHRSLLKEIQEDYSQSGRFSFRQRILLTKFLLPPPFIYCPLASEWR